jgi:hypothetical protein
MGVCQVCGRRLQFPPERSGEWSVCPHCGRQTRLKPAPPELLEAAPPELPVASPDTSVSAVGESQSESDATLRRLKRSYLTLLMVAVILLGLCVAVVWIAEWLRAQAHQP